MSKLLKLQVANTVNILSKKLTLLQIVELLEKCKITPKGNLTNTSKKALLLKSLKSANTKSIEKLLSEANGKVSIKSDSFKNDLDLHEGFKSSKVERFLKAGEFEEAIRVAFVRINNRVKKMSGLSTDGASLMRSAFSKNDPILEINQLKTQEELDEQEGLMHIFEGSVLAFRNPQSHDDEKKISPQETQRILSLANYLMIVLDKVRVKNSAIK